MRAFSLLIGLTLAAWGFALAPTAAAIEDLSNPPQCVREGPPCGPEPVDVCVVGGRDCLLHVEMVVCVTEPCDWLTICVLRGQHCIVFTSGGNDS